MKIRKAVREAAKGKHVYRYEHRDGHSFQRQLRITHSTKKTVTIDMYDVSERFITAGSEMTALRLTTEDFDADDWAVEVDVGEECG
ncbi:MAG: hypothetical protein NTZ28_13070 [Nitrospirae bacterium]|nr:hypothetical protein [Nitrospirota bacterium]